MRPFTLAPSSANKRSDPPGFLTGRHPLPDSWQILSASFKTLSRRHKDSLQFRQRFRPPIYHGILFIHFCWFIFCFLTILWDFIKSFEMNAINSSAIPACRIVIHHLGVAFSSTTVASRFMNQWINESTRIQKNSRWKKKTSSWNWLVKPAEIATRYKRMKSSWRTQVSDYHLFDCWRLIRIFVPIGSKWSLGAFLISLKWRFVFWSCFFSATVSFLPVSSVWANTSAASAASASSTASAAPVSCLRLSPRQSTRSMRSLLLHRSSI